MGFFFCVWITLDLEGVSKERLLGFNLVHISEIDEEEEEINGDSWFFGEEEERRRAAQREEKKEMNVNAPKWGIQPTLVEGNGSHLLIAPKMKWLVPKWIVWPQAIPPKLTENSQI